MGAALRLSKNIVFRTASRSEPRFRSKIPLSARAFQAHLTAVCIKTEIHAPGFYENCNLLQFSILCALRRERLFRQAGAAPFGGCLFACQNREMRIKMLPATPSGLPVAVGRIVKRKMASIWVPQGYPCGGGSIPQRVMPAISLASCFLPWMLPWRAIMMRCACGEPAPCMDSVR